MTTFLEKVYLKYPNKNWNLKALLSNENISLDVVKRILDILKPVTQIESKPENKIVHIPIVDHLFQLDGESSDDEEYPYLWKQPDSKLEAVFDMFRNKNVTLEFIEQFIKNIDPTDYDFEFISSSPNITEEFIEKYIDRGLDWYYGLSNNKNLSLEFIEKYIDRDWDWEAISRNPNLTLEFIEKYIEKSWDWYGCLATHTCITIDFIFEHEDKQWNWRELSSNPKITVDFIEKHLDKEWYWYGISRNPNVTLEFIEKYQTKDWNWDVIISKPYITLEIIEQILNKDCGCFISPKNWTLCNKNWSWYNGISRNPNLTLEFIEKYIEKDWDWGEISRHQILTIEFVQKYIEKDWDWSFWGIPHNHYLTMDFIEAFVDKIDFFTLSSNNGEVKLYDYYLLRRTYTIQQTKKISEELLASAWNPTRFYDWCLDEEEKHGIQDMFTK